MNAVPIMEDVITFVIIHLVPMNVLAGMVTNWKAMEYRAKVNYN